MQEDECRPELPPQPALDYMIGYLYDAGPAMAGGMGAVPLSHSEIRAWQDNTGVDLSSWESKTLRTLSAAYLAQSQDSEAIDCPAPWSLAMPKESQADVGKKVQNVFKTLMATKPRR